MATKNKNKQSQSGSGEYSREQDLLKAGRLGRYEIKKKLGAGGMGAVYLALDPQLNRLVALKILPPDKAENTTLVKRFRAEAQAVAQLKHEHIVQIYESGELDGYMYISLEYVEGTDVQRLIRKRGRLPVRRATEIIKQVTLALEHASESGIVHRDIKPANLLITQSGVVKLTDLGLARALDDEETSITRDGTTVGTVDYMSPEQGRSSKAADIRSDLYSLGCTWYHMLTGTPPYPEGNITNKLHAHATATIPDPRSINESIPESIIGVIARLMAKKPIDRYQSAHELLEDLEAVKKNSRSEVSATDLAALASPEAIEEEGFEAPSQPATLPQRSKSKNPDDSPEESSNGSKTSRRNKTASTSSKKQKENSGIDSLPPRERKKLSEVEGKKENSFNSAPFVYAGIAIVAVAFVGLLYSVISGFGGAIDHNGTGDVDLLSMAEERQKAREEEIEKAKQDGLNNNQQASNKQNNPNQQTNPNQQNNPNQQTNPGASEVHGSQSSQSQADNKNLKNGSQIIAIIAPDKKTNATSAHSFKEAIRKATKPNAIIELQSEQLILWEQPVDIVDKILTLRAGKKSSGQILVNTTGALAEGFFRVQKGSLKLEGLHFGLLGYDLPGENELTLIRTTNADLDVRDCSFTIEENRKNAIVLHRAKWDSVKIGKANWQQCLIRGAAWKPFSFSGRKFQAMVQESLIAVGDQPVFTLSHPPRPIASDAKRELFVTDSIVIGKANIFEIDNKDKYKAPDTFIHLNRSGFVASRSVGPQPFLSVRNWPADFHESAEVGKLSNLKWINEETTFSGWNLRLQASISNARKDDFKAETNEQWIQYLGEKGLTGLWKTDGVSPDVFSRLATLEPADLKRYQIAGLAQAGPKVIEKLASITAPALARKTWRAELTFQSPPHLPLQKSPFNAEAKKLQVDLNKTDLGQFLASQDLSKPTFIEATGFGLRKCSPIAIINKQVKIQFKSTKGKFPLTLQPIPRKSNSSGKSTPWITVQNGTLELEGGIFRLHPPDKKFPMPSHWIQSENSTVRISKCYVTAPFEKHGRLSSLVRISQPKVTKRKGNGLSLEQSYLQYGGDLIDIDLFANTMQVRNSLLVSQNHLFNIKYQNKAQNQPRGVFEISKCTLSSRNGFFNFDLPATPTFEKPFVNAYVSETIFVAPVATPARNAPAVSLVSSTFNPTELPKRLWWWGNRNGFSPEVAKKLMGKPVPNIWPEFWGPGHVQSALFGADGVMLFNKHIISKDLKPSTFSLFEKGKAVTWGPNKQPIGAEVSKLDISDIASGSQPNKTPTRKSSAPLF